MKRPLLRVVCANHPSKTIGRVIAGPDGPEWLTWRPLSKPSRQYYLDRGEPVPQHWARRTSLAAVEADGGQFGDGSLPGLCPRCKPIIWVHVNTVMEALAKPSVHRVLTV